MNIECVIILGLPRGGTSVTAHVCHELGVPMLLPDDPKLKHDAPDSRYPKGDFECSAFTPICWELTDGPGGDPNTRPLRSRFRTEFTEEEINKLMPWLTKRIQYSHNNGFGLKKPRMTSILIPFVKLLTDNNIEPLVITVRRNMNDAIKSVAEKRGPTHCPDFPYEWASSIQHHNYWRLCQAEKAARDMRLSMLEVTYEDALELPQVFVAQIADFLKKPRHTYEFGRAVSAIKTNLKR